MACIVRSCENRFKSKPIDSTTGRKVTFHLLPKNKEMTVKWLISLDRLDLLENQSIKWRRVCSKHFSISDYGLYSLLPNAIPKISEDSAFRLEFNEEIPEDERKFYTKVYPTVDLVGERRVHCTVCNVHIGTAPAQESIIRMHPILKVTHCKKCHEFYNSGEFSKGEDGSELYCRWCGQGGEVYCCSKCPYVFCTNCIIQNLSKDCVNDIEENENWNCFVCAPKIMWHLRAQHWALMNSIEKQKQYILNKNFSESSIRKLMMKDMTTCCKKPKSGNISDSSCDSEISLSRKRKSSTPSSMDKKIVRKAATPKIENPVGAAADEEPPEPKKMKSNDVVVCTPDVLGMLSQNNANKPADPTSSISEQERQRQQQQQRQIQVQQQQMQQLNPNSIIVPPPHMTTPHQPSPVIASSQAPPLLIRNLNAQYRGLAPPVAPRKTIAGPRPPVATTPGQSPVYHTINGFRIDLNTAAQQETFRLPNGKLIQVKRQGTTAGTVGGTTPGLITHNAGVQQVNFNTNQLVRTQLNQLQSRGIQANTHTININQPNHGPVQQFTLQQPHMTTIRYAAATAQSLPTNTTITPSVANSQGNVLNHVMNGNGSIATVAIRPTLQQPTLVKQIFASTPLGQARNQLQSQIFSSMDICQHLTGKIHTLTNSNAYKSARNYTDVKELYIHLSYLFTYAIGRFKTLQEKCMDDMRCLGFAGDAASLESGQLEKYASDNDEDDIVIIEPKTTLIDLDSDNEDDQSTKTPFKSSVATVVKLPVVTKLPSLANLSKTPPALAMKTSIAEKPFPSLNQSLNIPAIIRPVAPQVAAPTATVATILQEEPPALAFAGDKLPALDSMECDLDITANFLAGMLDVELYEGTDTVQINNPPKKPRKKTTNKPNPHLIKQQQMQAREKEREMIKLDRKLKTPCSIQLERIDEVDDAARKKLEEYLESPIRVYSNKKKENGGTESSTSTNGDEDNIKDGDENGPDNGTEESQEIVTIVETIDEETPGDTSKEVDKETEPYLESKDKELSGTDKGKDSSLPEAPGNESSKAEQCSKVDEDNSVELDSNQDDASNAQTTSDTQDTSTVEENADENNDKVFDSVAEQDNADNTDECEQVELLEVDESQDDDLIEPIMQAEEAESSFEEENKKMDVDAEENKNGEEDEEKEDAEANSTTNNDALEASNNPTKKDEIDELIADNNECSNISSKCTAATE